MKIIPAGAGLGLGVKDYRVIFVFETDQELSDSRAALAQGQGESSGDLFQRFQSFSVGISTYRVGERLNLRRGQYLGQGRLGFQNEIGSVTVVVLKEFFQLGQELRHDRGIGGGGAGTCAGGFMNLIRKSRANGGQGDVERLGKSVESRCDAFVRMNCGLGMGGGIGKSDGTEITRSTLKGMGKSLRGF